MGEFRFIQKPQDRIGHALGSQALDDGQTAIAVGREGLSFKGTGYIGRKAEWPRWTPPSEMIGRQPELEQYRYGMEPGLENPLGPRAMYLFNQKGDTGYRIHGTPEWNSIGKNASSGCIRMINQDVMDLFDRVPDGTKVVVLNADGSMPHGLTLPPPQPAPDPEMMKIQLQAHKTELQDQQKKMALAVNTQMQQKQMMVDMQLEQMRHKLEADRVKFEAMMQSAMQEKDQQARAAEKVLEMANEQKQLMLEKLTEMKIVHDQIGRAHV